MHNAASIVCMLQRVTIQYPYDMVHQVLYLIWSRYRYYTTPLRTYYYHDFISNSFNFQSSCGWWEMLSCFCRALWVSLHWLHAQRSLKSPVACSHLNVWWKEATKMKKNSLKMNWKIMFDAYPFNLWPNSTGNIRSCSPQMINVGCIRHGKWS